MTTNPTIDLSAIPQVMSPGFYPLLWDTHRIQVLKGGAASGKSYATGQKILYKLLAERGHRFLVIRKVAKTLRHSVYDLLHELAVSWNMRELLTFNKTDMTISCMHNGNDIICAGLDDVEKLKSIVGVTDIWIEEASEVSEADFNQLDLRLRGETRYKKQITLTFNPISALHWLKRRFFDRHESDALVHESTYRDNKWLDSDTIERLEGITDPYFKAVYCDGEWGTLGNTVFTNFVIEDFDAEALYNVCTGMDYGWAHASTIQRVGFYDDEIYSFDEVYGRNWTNSDFMQEAADYFGEELYGWDITADSAEPDRIQEWRRAGYSVSPAKKGAGSLKYGIDFLSSKRWHIHATRCPNLAKEVPVFKRREDKDGNVLDTFVEINDDGIAACRYATEWIWGQNHGEISQYVSASMLGL